jgi:IK cytokine
MSLLQGNISTDDTPTLDDEELEQIFTSKDENRASAENRSQPSVPKKRTREEIINELKRKRAKQEESAAPSTLQTESRFKPIGNSASQQKRAAKKVSKKKALESVEINEHSPLTVSSTNASLKHVSQPKRGDPGKRREAEEEPVDDIFVGVGDYDGLGDMEDGSSDSDSVHNHLHDSHDGNAQKHTKANWFNDPEDEEDEIEQPKSPPEEQTQQQSNEPQKEALAQAPEELHQERLVPLASSSIKSISEFLDFDKGLEAEEKRKARREKRKGKKRE